MEDKAKIFLIFEKNASLIPVRMCWMDINGVVLGMNDGGLRGIGANNKLIGKTPYEFYPRNIADAMMNNIKQAVKEKKMVKYEEPVTDAETGETRWCITGIAPLFDDNNTNVVGVSITQTEIAGSKEKERLQKEIDKLRSKLIKRLQTKLWEYGEATDNTTQSFFTIAFSLIGELEKAEKQIFPFKDAVAITIKAKDIFKELTNNYYKIKKEYKNIESEIKKEYKKEEGEQLQVKLQKCKEHIESVIQELIATISLWLDVLKNTCHRDKHEMDKIAKFRDNVQTLVNNYGKFKEKYKNTASKLKHHQMKLVG